MKACILLFSLFGCLLADDPKPTFRWLNERSSSGIQHLSIRIGSVDHTVVLHPYNPLSYDDESGVDACIFKGHMMMDSNVEVLVTGGCAGSNTFDIAMVGGGMEGFRYSVQNGEALRPMRPTGSVLPDPESQPQIGTITNRVALPPQGFIYKLAIIYDKSWKAKFGSEAESLNAVKRAIAQAQIIFKWPSLTVPITLNVTSVTFQDIDTPTEVSGLEALVPFITDAANSWLGLTNTGSSGGLAYQPGVCKSNKMLRTATVRSYEDQTTGEIIAHELGHNLGMNHDFTDPFATPKTVLRDSNGVSCTDSNGVMDYYVTVQKWTTCSVEWFTNYYNKVVARYGKFCMDTA